MKAIITGSSGLIGSAAVSFYARVGWDVVGIDNDLRAEFFGPEGSTEANRRRLVSAHRSFRSLDVDIRDADAIPRIIADVRPDLIVHAAAQPSHDLAARIPFDDFTVNANGTLNLLEAFRKHSPRSVFVLLSTNKVYGDNPNRIALREEETRYDFADPRYANGIDETFSIDHCTHSLFGVSKTAGDLLAQEYGRYFGLDIGVFRGGCLTGPVHAAVELHGFLSHLVKSIVHGRPYTIYGYKGKQVRDQIHSDDVVSAIEAFRRAPGQGEVYNIGGGKENAASVLECITKVCQLAGLDFAPGYSATNRIGDHVCYYSDLSKFRARYPEWHIEHSLDSIVSEIVAFEMDQRG